MSPQISLKKRAFFSPPPIKERASQKFSSPQLKEPESFDSYVGAGPKPKRGIRWAEVGLQFGLAVNAMAGSANSAQAAGVSQAEIVQIVEHDRAATLDLAVDSVDLRTSVQEFVAEEFTAQDTQVSLQSFAENGRIFQSRIGTDRDLSIDAASNRLYRGKSVNIELPDGSSQEISSIEDLQALDTFNGKGINPIAPPEVVRALRGLELGVDGDDGLIRNEFGLTDEDTFSAYQSYKVLTSDAQDSTGAKVKGALIGGAVIGAGIGIAAFGGGAVLPGIAAAVSSATPAMIAGAGVAVATGMIAGAYASNRTFKMDNPGELEVRYGIDSGLKVKTLDHAVDTFQWLQDRAANPFTEDQQEVALQHFDGSVGFFDEEGARLNLGQVQERLAVGEEVKVPSSIPGHSDSISNLRELQQLDTVRGSGINPVLPMEVSQSLRELESGAGVADGLYKAGNFQSDGRLSAFEAVDILFRERQPINAVVRSKQYDTKTLANIQELNALMGDGVNTILPAHQFEALRRFGESEILYQEQTVETRTSRGQVHRTSDLAAVDAYEALQAIRSGHEVKVESRDRFATVRSLEDLHELKSMEFDRRNSILGDRDFDLLRHWDLEGDYRVDQNGQQDFAYEALQALQSGNEFGIAHRDRMATVATTEDMVELAALETPDAGFEHSIADLEYELLKHWESSGNYRVDGDHTEYAYEALQALQSGQEFEIHRSGRFAPVSSYRDMIELSAFETPEAGFEHTIPADQFARLSHFEQAGGTATTRVGQRTGRAYEGYRALRNGRHFDVAAGGVWNKVTGPQSLHDLDALLGRGVNDILPQDQYDLLKHLGDEQSGEGLFTNGARLNSYSALQEFRAERAISYDFNGGDFGNLLHLETENLESLERTREIRDNQREYDRYAYSAEDWQDKMQQQAAALPADAQANLDYGQSELNEGERELSWARSALSDAESDLSRARRYKSDAEADLRDAESYLRWANGLPTYIDEEVEYCDDSGDCWWEIESTRNWEKDREVSSARSDVSSAESHVRSAQSDIRRALSDISSAESDISAARRAISRANDIISDAETVLAALPNYQRLLEQVGDANFEQVIGEAKTHLAYMEERTHTSGLQGSLDRQQRLIHNQESRPERPTGWVVPAREDLAQF